MGGRGKPANAKARRDSRRRDLADMGRSSAAPVQHRGKAHRADGHRIDTTGRSKRDSSAAYADAFTRSEREEKASAYFGRNDRLFGGETGVSGPELLGLGGAGGGFLVLEVVEELFGFGVVGSEGEGFLGLGAGESEFVLFHVDAG